MNAKLRIKLLPILVFRKKSLHLPIESPILPCSAPHSSFLSAEQRQNSQLLRSHSLEKKIWNGYTQCFQPWTYFLGLWKCCFIRLKRLFHTPETTVSYAWNNCFIRLKQLFHTLETLKNSEISLEKPRKYTGSPYFLTPLRNLWFLLGANRVVI